MQSAVLVIDVQQGLCEGEAAAFDCEGTTARRALAVRFPVTLVSDAHTSAGNSAISAQDVIAHHNATLGNISSFGPRVQTVPSHSIAFP
jgi:nicotinamidase-related amidase